MFFPGAPEMMFFAFRVLPAYIESAIHGGFSRTFLLPSTEPPFDIRGAPHSSQSDRG
jgi:hypothetical protein